MSSSAVHRKSKLRRYEMTTREASAFGDMFDIVFQAVQENDSTQTRLWDPLGAGIGTRHSEIQDLAHRLRQHSKNVKWTTEADQELDRKKEEMALCDTDYQLLDWATREVFGGSQIRPEDAHSSSSEDSQKRPIQIPSPSYPHLLALLMRTLRDKYSDPHLAAAIFDRARSLSIASYVFGCTTPVYNEVIETRWRCFRDLRGVCEALAEMRVNGVEMDTRTRNLAETVRREVGERNLWDDNAGSHGEVWELISRIERLTATETQRHVDKSSKPWNRSAEQWKNWGPAATEKSEDRDRSNGRHEWEFGNWEERRPVVW